MNKNFNSDLDDLILSLTGMGLSTVKKSGYSVDSSHAYHLEKIWWNSCQLNFIYRNDKYEYIRVMKLLIKNSNGSTIHTMFRSIYRFRKHLDFNNLAKFNKLTPDKFLLNNFDLLVNIYQKYQSLLQLKLPRSADVKTRLCLLIHPDNFTFLFEINYNDRNVTFKYPYDDIMCDELTVDFAEASNIFHIINRLDPVVWYQYLGNMIKNKIMS